MFNSRYLLPLVLSCVIIACMYLSARSLINYDQNLHSQPNIIAKNSQEFFSSINSNIKPVININQDGHNNDIKVPDASSQFIKLEDNDHYQYNQSSSSNNVIINNIDQNTDLNSINNKNQAELCPSSNTMHKELVKLNAVIDSNLVSALKSLGVPYNSIMLLVNSYSGNVNFYSQVKKGDTISIVLEKFIDSNNNFSHYGKVMYSSLNLSGKSYDLYNYNTDHNTKDQNSKNNNFFLPDGVSVEAAKVLTLPLKTILVTSRYGKRKHPILGYVKMHRGVDLAAPAGTPIYSSGYGKVIFKGCKSGFGNFVQIQHANNTITSYAHASKFARDLHVGKYVKQGEVIAYVGSTGRATAPHVHFEVSINGKTIDPLSIKFIPKQKLQGQQLAKFVKFKEEIKNLSDKKLPSNNQGSRS
ncbi:MAG: M23 family metallopeptidase [Rickettsiaceae bacterium]